MLKKYVTGMLIAWLIVGGSAAWAKTEFKIVTASERGTYIQIGRDLAKFVAPDADIALDVLPSRGSSENVNRLRHEPGVKFAIVQSDVYQAFLNQAQAGNAEAGRLIHPLRLILPLYNEEIYFVTRADSPLQYIHEIKDQRINAGPLQSGTALSTATLYEQMFKAPLPDATTTFLTNEEALVKLTTDKSIDVVVVIAGQPAKLFVDMKPEAKQHIKLLKFDPQGPASRNVLATYFATAVRAASYPNWLERDVPTLAIKAFLVTYDYRTKHTTIPLAKFARSLCQNFPTLQAQGHPKWKEVELSLPALGKGWFYYPVVERELRACLASAPQSTPRPKADSKPCSQQAKILGLCER